MLTFKVSVLRFVSWTIIGGSLAIGLLCKKRCCNDMIIHTAAGSCCTRIPDKSSVAVVSASAILRMYSRIRFPPCSVMSAGIESKFWPSSCSNSRFVSRVKSSGRRCTILPNNDNSRNSTCTRSNQD
jgi:hypothetical protein